MPTGVLLDPNNRLLGGATGDFSLYGAQPAVTIGTARPPAADPTLLTVPSSPAPAAPAAEVAPAAPSPISTDTPLAGESAPQAAAALALQSLQAPAAVASPTLAPQVASPTGSGSTAPIVADTALPLTARAADAAEPATAMGQGLSAASLAAPVLAGGEAVSLPSVALAPAIAALGAPQLVGLDAPVGDVVSAGVARAEDATALLDRAVTDAVPSAVEPVIGAATPAIDATVGPAGLVTPASETVAAVAAALPKPEAVTEAVAAALPEAEAAVETVTAALPKPEVVTEAVSGAEAVADVVAASAVAAVDKLADTGADAPGLTATTAGDEVLGGSDPAGGVTTLVSMVETAAVFEVGRPGEQPQAAAASGSIVDSLASDEAPGALLGDAAPADDDEDSLVTDLDNGVPGLP